MEISNTIIKWLPFHSPCYPFSPWAESLSQPLWNFCFWLNIQFLFIQQDLLTVSLFQGLEKRTIIIIIINIITFSLNPIKRINELLIFSPNHGNLTLFFGAPNRLNQINLSVFFPPCWCSQETAKKSCWWSRKKTDLEH